MALKITLAAVMIAVGCSPSRLYRYDIVIKDYSDPDPVEYRTLHLSSDQAYTDHQIAQAIAVNCPMILVAQVSAIPLANSAPPLENLLLACDTQSGLTR
jgi:hypothetical protein